MLWLPWVKVASVKFLDTENKMGSVTSPRDGCHHNSAVVTNIISALSLMEMAVVVVECDRLPG